MLGASRSLPTASGHTLTEKSIGADSQELVALVQQYADAFESIGNSSEADARRKQADRIVYPEIHEPTPAE